MHFPVDIHGRIFYSIRRAVGDSGDRSDITFLTACRSESHVTRYVNVYVVNGSAEFSGNNARAQFIACRGPRIIDVEDHSQIFDGSGKRAEKTAHGFRGIFVTHSNIDRMSVAVECTGIT